jgi:hypothetical protein
LKTANVFLNKSKFSTFFEVKIGDLGVAKLLETTTACAQTMVGTPVRHNHPEYYYKDCNQVFQYYPGKDQKQY